MNIAIFTDCYIPIKNGVVTSVRQLKEGLEEKGHNVIIVTVDVPNFEEKDLSVYRLPSFGASFGSGTDTRLGSFVNQGAINRFLKKKEIQLIHTHTEFVMGYYGKKAAKKLKIPCIHTTHTMWEEYRHYVLNGKLISRNMARKIISTYLKGIYGIVSPSIKAQNYYRDLTPHIPSVVINNGIDVAKFKSSVITENEVSQLKKEFNLKKNDKIILFVGRIGREKRVTELLDIVSSILKADSQIKMIYTGTGPQMQQLADIAENIGISKQVIFTGFVNWELVYQLYSISDLFVTASLSEVQPMTLIEATMCGLPIICRKDESYMDLVTEGVNGYLLDNDYAMTKKISELLYDDVKRKKFSDESYKSSERFTAKNHVNRMEKFYTQVVKCYPDTLEVDSIF